MDARYQIRISAKCARNGYLIADQTDCVEAGITKAALAGANLFDTKTGLVYSHQTQCWLKPETQAAIEGSTNPESNSFKEAAKAILYDANVLGAAR